MIPFSPPPFCPPEAPEASFLPSLYITPAQVDSKELNPHEDKALQLKEVVKWHDDNGFFGKASAILSCGHKFVHLKDKNGHEKYVGTHCKYEFCPTCGENGSREHRTKTTRVRDRLMWAPVLGYLVFTLPKDLSASRLDRDKLNALEKEAYNIIRRRFKAEGGMVRVHFAGETDGSLRIHINVLFPVTGTNGIGKVDPLVLENTRKDWTDFVNSFFSLSLETTDIHYTFATSRKQKAHKIKYVLRPIINAWKFMRLSHEDKLYIASLGRWHNTRWYGKLSNALYKKYLLSIGVDPEKNEREDVYLSKICPLCGERFKFVDIVRRSDISRQRFRWLDNDTAVDFEIYAELRKKDTP